MANGNVYGREPATGRAAAALPQIRILCAACRKHVYRRGKNLEFSDTEEQKMAARKSVLLFWSLDRLCREGTVETLNHLQRLTSYGVNYRSFTEQYLDSCGIFRDAVLSILATIAQQERVRISERVQAGLSRARAQGKVLGRPRAAMRSERVLQLRKRGLSIREIAAETGVSAMTVQRLLSAKAS